MEDESANSAVPSRYVLFRAFLDRVRPSDVPRCQRYYQSTKTSGAYYELAYGFAFPLRLLLPTFAPARWGSARGPGPAISRSAIGYPKSVNHRSSQVPGES